MGTRCDLPEELCPSLGGIDDRGQSCRIWVDVLLNTREHVEQVVMRAQLPNDVRVGRRKVERAEGLVLRQRVEDNVVERVKELPTIQDHMRRVWEPYQLIPLPPHP